MTDIVFSSNSLVSPLQLDAQAEASRYVYQLVEREQQTEDTYRYILRPQFRDHVFSFSAGQYAKLSNPAYHHPSEEHCFSIVSTPFHKQYLEFSIKVFGSWTQSLTQLPLGSSLFVRAPLGTFVWDDTTQYAVMLVGGLGIAPLLSMLRTLSLQGTDAKIILLYGNRRRDTAVYLDELHELSQKLDLSVVPIFDDEPRVRAGEEKGFITSEIIMKRVALEQKPTYYLCGPPTFLQVMRHTLHQLAVSNSDIRMEKL